MSCDTGAAPVRANCSRPPKTSRTSERNSFSARAWPAFSRGPLLFPSYSRSRALRPISMPFWKSFCFGPSSGTCEIASL